MATKTLMIKQLSRFPKTGDFDELNFKPGVNVLVGKPNTGKTQWLRMLNFLMGDRDSNANNAFKEILVNKYDSIRGVFIIDGKEIILERRWKEPGSKGKVFVNGESINAEDFSAYLMPLLDIPLVHFPQGNPLSPRAWPELSWGSLLRHIYRKQTSWGELVNKQPRIDQHACILLFLGIAEHLFSPAYEQLSEKQKEIYKHQVRKEEFTRTLDEISRELLNNDGLGVTVTTHSIALASQRLDSEVEVLLSQRDGILALLKDNTLQGMDSIDISEFEHLSETWAQRQADRKEISLQLEAAQVRLRDLEEYKGKIQDEFLRLERSVNAGEVFRDLRVTHCPVCEQSVKTKTEALDKCYLCMQQIKIDPSESIASEQRLDFEIEQLRAEIQEAQELIEVVMQEIKSLHSYQRSTAEEVTYIQSQMTIVQAAATAIMPPEISRIDMDLGRVQERQRQIGRIENALKLKEELSEKIYEIEKDVNRLEVDVAKLTQSISYEEAASHFSEQINTYLNAIKHRNPNSWTQGKVGLKLKDKSFKFTVGQSDLSDLGATMTLYFLPAYNYALLSLSNIERYCYPGLSILDFPATFGDGTPRRTTENFILQPFIDLVKQPRMNNTQVIAVGSAFEGLSDVHRINLTHVWKE
jgi:energy-coupling factor transporter ATP-binding protein EcfA2